MADSFPTLADVLKVNDQNLADLMVTDLLDDAPMLGALFAQPSSNGSEHKYLKETAAPVVGFRNPNTGRDFSKSGDTLVTINLKIVDGSNATDKPVADSMTAGAETWVARENARHLRRAFFDVEKQFINGTIDGGAALGFTGFANVINTLGAGNIIDAGGAGADLTSIYLIRTGESACSAVFNELAGGGIMMGDTIVQAITDTVNGGTFPGYYTPVTGWAGLQIGSFYDVVRICNIGAAANKATDDLLYQALELFPSGRQPNLIVCNRRSLRQLREDRTTYNPTGLPAPRPQDLDGIPIISTDGIINTETVVTA